MQSVPDVKLLPVITRPFLITRCRCLILRWRLQRLCKSRFVYERMPHMFFRRNIYVLFLAPLLVLLVSVGCKKTADTPTGPANAKASTTSSESSHNPAIEIEVVAPQAIAGAILATGK